MGCELISIRLQSDTISFHLIPLPFYMDDDNLPVEDLVDALGGMRQHGFERDAGRETAVLWQGLGAVLQQRWDYQVVIGTLAVRRLYQQRVLVHSSLRKVLRYKDPPARSPYRRPPAYLQLVRSESLGIRESRERRGLRQRLQHRLLGQPDAQLAFQRAEQVARLARPAGHVQSLDPADLLVHRRGSWCVRHSSVKERRAFHFPFKI